MRIFQYRYLCILSFLLLFSLVAFGSRPAGAEQLAPAKITALEVTTLDGKSLKNTPLMAGGTYKVNFAIEVAAGLKEDCVLKTSLERGTGMDRFWTLKGDYTGIDSDSWQPGQPTLSFQAVEGTAQLELVGSVPANYLSDNLTDGQALNMSKKIALIELSLASGTVIAEYQFEVVNNSIEEYREALSDKKLLLANMEADPAYTSLVQSLIARAEAEANIGYTDMAMDTLETIPNSGWVKPQSKGSTFYLWIIAGILAIIAAVSAFMFIRARGEISDFRRQSDSQAKNLQILAKKASRIGDPALTAGIEQLRKELEQSVGGG